MSAANQSLNLNGKSLAEVDLDEQEEIVVALMEQGFLAPAAKQAVKSTFIAGDSFSGNFRRALQMVTQLRSSGRLNLQYSPAKVSSRATSAAPRGKAGASPLAPDPLPQSTDRNPDPQTLSGGGPSAPASGAESQATDRAHTPTPKTGRRLPKTPRRDTPAQPQPLTKKENSMARKCACGCGEEMNPGSPWKYKRGHKPKGVASQFGKKPGQEAHSPEPEASSNNHAPVAIVNINNGHVNGREHNLIPVSGQISELMLDRLWTSMSAQEKAALLFPPQKAEA